MLKFITFLFACFMQLLPAYSQDVTVSPKMVTCNGSKDGSITIIINIGSPEYTIKLYDKTPAVKQKTLKEIQTKDNKITFRNLQAKKYYILITDSNQHRIVKEVLVEEPEPLTFIGYQIITYPKSEESKDGSVELNVSGGSKPYNFRWDDAAGNQDTQIATNLNFGVYNCTINDKNNCGPLRPSVLFLKNPKNN